MNHHCIPLRFFLRLLGACAIGLLVLCGDSAAIAAPNQDLCALLRPSDLTALIGAAPIAKALGSNCKWTASGSNRQLMLLRHNLQSLKMSTETVFANMRQSVQKTGKFTDESGIGDKAFSVVMDSGLVVVAIIKQGHLLQLQYSNQAAATATAKDLDALRSVAKKAAAAL